MNNGMCKSKIQTEIKKKKNEAKSFRLIGSRGITLIKNYIVRIKLRERDVLRESININDNDNYRSA